MKKPAIGDRVRCPSFDGGTHDGEVVNLLSAQFAYQRYVDGEKRGRYLCLYSEAWEKLKC